MKLINLYPNAIAILLLAVISQVISAPVADPKTHKSKAGDICNATKSCHHGLVCVDTSAGPGEYKPVAPNCDGICRPLVNEGSPCGGFVVKQVVCHKGLTCHMTPLYAGGNPDLGGVCRKVAGKGKACGGDAYTTYPILCASGLTCKSHKSDKPGFGHCQP